MFTATSEVAAVILAPERNGTYWNDDAAKKLAGSEYATRLSAELGLNGTPERIAGGAFHDAFVYRASQNSAQESPDVRPAAGVPILVGTYALTGRNEGQPFATVFILVELPDCYLRGAQINWLSAPPAFEERIPEPLRGRQPLQQPREKLQVIRSPVRVTFRGNESSESFKLGRILGEAGGCESTPGVT